MDAEQEVLLKGLERLMMTISGKNVENMTTLANPSRITSKRMRLVFL